MKTCHKCKHPKHPSEFHRDRTQADGLRSRCKVCANRDKRRQYKANPGKKATYYQANRERILATMRVWREENPDYFSNWRRS